MRRSWRNQSGDTLVEVVFALVILTAVLMTALALGRLSRVNSQNSLLRSQAINMVQEQYEALREFRDANPYSWVGFSGGSGCTVACSNYTRGFSGSAIKYDSTCNLVTAPTLRPCIFHMERDPRVTISGVANANYGQWIPCPGPWHPPLDADTGASGWTSATDATGYGCGGDSRTVANQPNISVSIQLMSPMFCPGEPKYFAFNINATWPQGGLSDLANTNLTTIIANLRGDPGC